jgi:hypothetical protein
LILLRIENTIYRFGYTQVLKYNNIQEKDLNFVCIGSFRTSYIVWIHIFGTDHCRQIERRYQLSFKLLGFLKAKTGGSLKILHNYGCFCMVVQCLRTMLDNLLSAGWYVMTNGTLMFVFFSVYWMRSFLSIPLALQKQCLMLALL